MGQSYEFNGELFDNVESFLEALKDEYRKGDRDLVMSKLNDYGFDLSDLGVRPHGDVPATSNEVDTPEA